MSLDLGEFLAVACQMDTVDGAVGQNLKQMVTMIDWAMEGYSALGVPVRLIVFPELAIHGSVGATYADKRRHAIELPGPEIEELAEKARTHGVYLVAGTVFEYEPEYDAVFNTLVMLAPSGKIVLRYRKVNVWYPLETTQSPIDLLGEGYDTARFPLFPVAHTEIGTIGGLICYDGFFPEVTRQLAAEGAEIFVRASAIMDPWGSGPTGASVMTDRMRSLENLAYTVSAQRGSSPRTGPPFSWPGRSSIVDFEGRVLSEAERGEEIIMARIDANRVRAYRESVLGGNMLAHNRTEAYDYLTRPGPGPRPRLSTGRTVSETEHFATAREQNDAYWAGYYERDPFWRRRRDMAARERDA
ncbi:nitrilase-related carbon-nitrogen hydrolase [Microbispora sp. NPDC046933]|uniref:nitrilase-related carbon-nitrogen hydrolase n=1 Tax=Microbispora sp. NPDC046933 TaxID=3155618 RepID=UPI003405D072